jgi:hypothetical protein
MNSLEHESSGKGNTHLNFETMEKDSAELLPDK